MDSGRVICDYEISSSRPDIVLNIRLCCQGSFSAGLLNEVLLSRSEPYYCLVCLFCCDNLLLIP